MAKPAGEWNRYIITCQGNRLKVELNGQQIIDRAVRAGYGSVMVDGSRLPLEGNIDCTKEVVEIAHAVGIPVEAELGAIMGHEAGPLPPYDELFESGQGFTDPAQAKRFVEETKVDWLSIAIGNIHGAISAARKSERKIEARLDINRLDDIREAVGIPLVLLSYGGSSIVATMAGMGLLMNISMRRFMFQ